MKSGKCWGIVVSCVLPVLLNSQVKGKTTLNSECKCTRNPYSAEVEVYTEPTSEWSECRHRYTSRSSNAGCYDNLQQRTVDCKVRWENRTMTKQQNCTETRSCIMSDFPCTGTWAKWSPNGECSCKTRQQTLTRYCYEDIIRYRVSKHCTGSEGEIEQNKTVSCRPSNCPISPALLTTTTTTTTSKIMQELTTTVTRISPVTTTIGNETTIPTDEAVVTDGVGLSVNTIVIIVAVTVVAVVIIALFIIILITVRKTGIKRKETMRMNTNRTPLVGGDTSTGTSPNSSVNSNTRLTPLPLTSPTVRSLMDLNPLYEKSRSPPDLPDRKMSVPVTSNYDKLKLPDSPIQKADGRRGVTQINQPRVMYESKLNDLYEKGGYLEPISNKNSPRFVHKVNKQDNNPYLRPDVHMYCSIDEANGTLRC